MADAHALELVTQALALQRTHPHAPARDTLDLVMVNHLRSDPDFEAERNQPFFDWTDPNSPFGELLRQAFAPDEVAPGQGALWASEEPKDDAAIKQLVQSWQTCVIDRFAERYNLWR